MTARLGILTLVVVLLAALAVTDKEDAFGRGCPPGMKNCALCHAGSIPTTHRPEFIRTSHGRAALANRATCLSCHEPASCRDCHVRETPAWHTDALMNPADGPDDRTDHANLARNRDVSCLECHRDNFLEACSDCHEPGEWTP